MGRLADARTKSRPSLALAAALALCLTAGCQPNGGLQINHGPVENNPPQITELTASPGATVEPGGTLTITATASDPDGDPLTYSWSADAGAIAGGGASITWRAPGRTGTFTITCVVNDGKGGYDNESTYVTAV